MYKLCCLLPAGDTDWMEHVEQVYGEGNSVKKHNYKVWLNDGVY